MPRFFGSASQKESWDTNAKNETEYLAPVISLFGNHAPLQAAAWLEGLGLGRPENKPAEKNTSDFEIAQSQVFSMKQEAEKSLASR